MNGMLESGRDRESGSSSPSRVEVARIVLRDAVAAQARRFERRDLLAWCELHAPLVDPELLDGLLVAGTVNDPRRQHFPAREDMLYAAADGWLERYDPQTHGRWTKLGLPDTSALTEPALAQMGRLLDVKRIGLLSRPGPAA